MPWRLLDDQPDEAIDTSNLKARKRQLAAPEMGTAKAFHRRRRPGCVPASYRPLHFVPVKSRIGAAVILQHSGRAEAKNEDKRRDDDEKRAPGFTGDAPAGDDERGIFAKMIKHNNANTWDDDLYQRAWCRHD